MAKAERDPIDNRGAAPAADVAAVLAAFNAACKRWKPPTEADCARIAWTIEFQRQLLVKARAARPPPPEPTAAGQRRIVRFERVREAMGMLLDDLPAFVADPERGQPVRGQIVTAGTDHALVLAEWLAATRRAASYWPSLDGRVRRFAFPPRWWGFAAGALARRAYAGLGRANPGTRIGLPSKGDAPMTGLLVRLLKLAGHTVNEDALAAHFRRTPRQFFLWSGEAADADGA